MMSNIGSMIAEGADDRYIMAATGANNLDSTCGVNVFILQHGERMSICNIHERGNWTITGEFLKRQTFVKQTDR